MLQALILVFAQFNPNTSARTEVFPLALSSLSIKWEHAQNEIFMRRKLSGKLKFVKGDYQNIRQFFKDHGACTPLSLEFVVACANGTSQVYGNGYKVLDSASFSLPKCVIDESKCQLEVEPEITDQYECILKKADEEINLIDKNVESYRVTLPNFTSIQSSTCDSNGYTLEYGTPWYWCGCPNSFPEYPCDYYFNPPSYPLMGGYENHFDIFSNDRSDHLTFDSSSFTFESKAGVRTVWKRELKKWPCAANNLPLFPPGSNWVMIKDDCANSGFSYFARPSKSKLDQGVYNKSAAGGVHLKEVIDRLLSGIACSYPVVSDFFQINPENPDTINYVSGLPTRVDNLIFMQKSDWVCNYCSERATKMNYSWAQFSTAMRSMFNVYWDLEQLNGITVLRLEHYSYFKRNTTLDLTASQYSKYLAGKNRYSTETAAIPKQENFKFFEAVYDDFKGLPIYYGGPCVGDNEEDHEAPMIVTDIYGLEAALDNTDSEGNINLRDIPAASETEGIMLFACYHDPNVSSDHEMLIYTEKGMLSQQQANAIDWPNGHLAFANLQYYYHRSGRYLDYGFLNNSFEYFSDTRKKWKKDLVSIPFCCDTLDTKGTVTLPESSMYGQAELQSAEFKFQSQMLDLELLLNLI